MALLRNLRNLLQKDVPVDTFKEKLIQGAKNGKQLPFRYLSAYEAVKSLAPGGLLDAIEDCLNQSIGELPEFAGKMMVLTDNSGSAWGAFSSSMGTMPVARIGNLTGVLTAMRAEEGYVGVFGDRLEVVPIRKKSSVFDQVKTVNDAGNTIGGRTENGIWLFWDKAIREKEHWDNVFVYSDMQAGHGDLYGINSNEYKNYRWRGSGEYIDVPKLISTYRKEVNPNVNVFLVQTAGYKDTLIPEFYDKTYILGGWSEGVIKFAHKMSNIPMQ